MTEETASGSRFVELADHGTDAVAIGGLVILGLYGSPSWELVGTIASVAVGKNYLRKK